jgi:hypothetical protein
LRQNYRGGNGRARLENAAGYRELANGGKPVASIREEPDVYKIKTGKILFREAPAKKLDVRAFVRLSRDP